MKLSEVVWAWRRRRWLRWLLSAVGISCTACAVAWTLLPVVAFDNPISTALLARDGQLLGASIAADGQWRFGEPDSVPRKFRVALTLFEDRRFEHHVGVDPTALGRAIWQNLKARDVVSGGSTITMQVARMACGNRPRTVVQKLWEIALALKLDQACSKEKILRMWAGHAPFGGNVVGLEAASWRYFGCHPHSLSWAQAATLAVLPNAPALIHPGRNREKLLTKRDRLLDRLHDEGHLDSLSCSLAKRESLPDRPCPLPQLTPHLLARYGPASAQKWEQQGGLGLVHTAVDAHVQVQATEVVSRHIEQLRGNGIHNAAALIIAIDSGDIVGYVGNHFDPADNEHAAWVDIIRAPRSTGSILKPLLYASMLESGEILPAQLVPDIPTRIGGFAPVNHSGTYDGAVPAREVLARSLNVPAVWMLHAHGTYHFIDRLRKLGITTLTRPPDQYGLALILGGSEATLWDVVNVYASLARCVNLNDTSGNLCLSPGVCFATLEAMTDASRPGAKHQWRQFTSSEHIAWKTGTSQGYRDAWAIGVTPRYAVGVWVGNATGEGRPGLTGHQAAAPILFELFDLLDGCGWFIEPCEDMAALEVCKHSGMRCGRDCVATETLRVPLSAYPGQTCSYCRLVHCDANRTWRVHADCASISDMVALPWFALPSVIETYYRRVNPDYRPLPPFRSDCQDCIDEPFEPAMACIYPPDGGMVYVPTELDGKVGRVVFEAIHHRPSARVFWHLDDAYCGCTQETHQIELSPTAGEHLLTLVDDAGAEIRRSFGVLAGDAH
ncbi:penicillin-binding protein 1C [Candidatus Eisenbacteria bacterium]|uniref:peptidoglycan glycosyltransferase n=1 Tax=Eiseniibacteriota bacterium TaxID=2212470 RepID=A0ABV6YL63_UNCEI